MSEEERGVYVLIVAVVVIICVTIVRVNEIGADRAAEANRERPLKAWERDRKGPEPSPEKAK